MLPALTSRTNSTVFSNVRTRNNRSDRKNNASSSSSTSSSTSLSRIRPKVVNVSSNSSMDVLEPCEAALERNRDYCWNLFEAGETSDPCYPWCRDLVPTPKPYPCVSKGSEGPRGRPKQLAGLIGDSENLFRIMSYECGNTPETRLLYHRPTHTSRDNPYALWMRKHVPSTDDWRQVRTGEFAILNDPSPELLDSLWAMTLSAGTKNPLHSQLYHASSDICQDAFEAAVQELAAFGQRRYELHLPTRISPVTIGFQHVPTKMGTKTGTGVTGETKPWTVDASIFNYLGDTFLFGRFTERHQPSFGNDNESWNLSVALTEALNRYVTSPDARTRPDFQKGVLRYSGLAMSDKELASLLCVAISQLSRVTAAAIKWPIPPPPPDSGWHKVHRFVTASPSQRIRDAYKRRFDQ